MSTHRLPDGWLADYYMADEMYRASPDGRAEEERVQRVLAENSTPGTMALTGYPIGDCVIELRDINTIQERAVVTRADPHVMASAELVEQWLNTPGPYVAVVDGRRFTFGTEGEELGVVTYELGELSTTFAPEPYYMLHRRGLVARHESEEQ